jgi:SAM-dependent methyltransferase
LDSTPYPELFYELTSAGSLLAARRILPLLNNRHEFKSVIDVGCGTGTWLLAAQELGVSNLHGIEGPHIPRNKLLVDPAFIEVADLAEQFSIKEPFDLCLCLEVAEHLPPDRAESFIADLALCSPIILFSAAIPYQGGDGHVNEIWPEYWARLFSKHSYLPWTGLRESIWALRDIPWWYRQNLILYVKESIWEKTLTGETPCPLMRLTSIHPESYLWNVRRNTTALKTKYNYDCDVYYACLTNDLIHTPGYGPEFSAPRDESSHNDDH